jgi:hypothetical protein
MSCKNEDFCSGGIYSRWLFAFAWDGVSYFAFLGRRSVVDNIAGGRPMQVDDNYGSNHSDGGTSYLKESMMTMFSLVAGLGMSGFC